jgi:hypothetical protein
MHQKYSLHELFGIYQHITTVGFKSFIRVHLGIMQYNNMVPKQLSFKHVV